MTGHRQEMLNVTLSVGEIQEAIERRIMEKYKFLVDQPGNWELQDIHFHKENLHGADQNKQGATVFFVQEIPVAEDVAPLKESRCGDVCTKCLKSCL
jgi:hypothetical protein